MKMKIRISEQLASRSIGRNRIAAQSEGFRTGNNEVNPRDISSELVLHIHVELCYVFKKKLEISRAARDSALPTVQGCRSLRISHKLHNRGMSYVSSSHGILTGYMYTTSTQARNCRVRD